MSPSAICTCGHPNLYHDKSSAGPGLRCHFCSCDRFAITDPTIPDQRATHNREAAAKAGTGESPDDKCQCGHRRALHHVDDDGTECLYCYCREWKLATSDHSSKTTETT